MPREAVNRVAGPLEQLVNPVCWLPGPFFNLDSQFISFCIGLVGPRRSGFNIRLEFPVCIADAIVDLELSRRVFFGIGTG